MKQGILVLMLLLAGFAAHPQSFEVLSAADFSGAVPPNDSRIAYTNCYVSNNYDVTRHNGQYHIVFNIQLIFNHERSFIRYSGVTSAAHLRMVLKHEQGHYDIAYMLKCEAYSVLSSREYDANYQAEIAAMFSSINAKYQEMNARYEAETANMTNIKNQQKWNAWFDSQPCLQTTSLAKAYN